MRMGGVTPLEWGENNMAGAREEGRKSSAPLSVQSVSRVPGGVGNVFSEPGDAIDRALVIDDRERAIANPTE